MEKAVVFWFRRDLRIHDNAGLYHALQSGLPVIPLFVFDRSILDLLDDSDDARVTFIHREITRLNEELNRLGSSLLVEYGFPLAVLQNIAENYAIQAVYTNHDYEPYALERDAAVAKMLKSRGIEFHTFKDQVIFEKAEIVKDDGRPYTVFTPYSRKWKAALTDYYLKPYPSEERAKAFITKQFHPIPALSEMGFSPSSIAFPEAGVDAELLKRYADRRNFPAIKGTSRLSIHLRFGTVSIRALAAAALQNSEAWLNELIWRDFYQMILFHFPHSAKSAFKPAYDKIVWRNNQEEFEKWCQGKTGYPIVDAGMRELLATGFMHNRVRMIVASFLTKHLLIDWRWGEQWFARKLLDFELASNNGGWQWAAGSGCDAAPYFRVFNPLLQTEKFDPRNEYIRKWVPELYQHGAYPKPIVEHAFARQRAIETYKEALSGS